MRYLSGKLLEILKNNLECLGAYCNPSQNRRYRGLVQGYWNSQVTLSGATFSCSKRMLVAQPTRYGGVKKNVKCFECFEVSRKNRTHVTNSGIRTVFWMFWMVFVAKYVAEKTCGTVSWNDSDAKNDLEWSWILCPISSSLKAELFLILAFFQANHPVLEHGNGKPPFIIYSWFSH